MLKKIYCLGWLLCLYFFLDCFLRIEDYENVSVTKKDETELVWNHFELNFVLNYMYIMLHIVCKKLVLLMFHKIVMLVNTNRNYNVIILQLCQVTVKEEEGNNNSVTFQRLQTMLLEQFGMHGFHYEVLISVTLELCKVEGEYSTSELHVWIWNNLNHRNEGGKFHNLWFPWVA